MGDQQPTRMNFALLGDDLRTVSLVRAVLESGNHTLRCTALAPRCHQELRSAFPGLRAAAGWEELLADVTVDVVIVSSDDEQVLAAARQLLTAGKSLAMLPAPGQSSALMYELTLIQADAGMHLIPLLPLRGHPQVQELRRLIGLRAFGAVHHLQLERRLVPSSGTSLLSTEQLSRCLLEDIDLLRALGGDYDPLSASRSGDSARGVSLASVTLSGDGCPQAVWSATAAQGDASWALVLAGDRATARLSGTPEHHEFRLETTLPDGPKTPAGDSDDQRSRHRSESNASDLDRADPGPWLLDCIEDTWTGRAGAPGWTDMTRAFELLDAVDRSVRRRRTIDLHFEVPSERSVFKTQMTAAGCCLLMLTLFATVVYLLLGAMFDLGDTAMQIARALIFLPLGVFLVLQVLLFLTRPSAPLPGAGGTGDRVADSDTVQRPPADDR